MSGRYYIACETAFTENEKRMASEKARDDITRILTGEDAENTFSELMVEFDTARWQNHPALVQIGEHIKAKKEWEMKTRELGSGDVLLIQFPAVNHSLFLYQVLRALKKRGVFLIAILHDVEAIRGAKRKNKALKTRLRKHFEEVLSLKYFDRLIVHNARMGELAENMLGIPGDRLVDLRIFDYLAGEGKTHEMNEGVVIAGNLTPVKAGYVYRLPGDVRWNLFGVNFAGKAISADSVTGQFPEKGMIYYGSFPADEIAGNLTGGFGLVWDGPSADNCEGVYGEYLRINNPHKTSLYLAAGLPVIIWEEAALAPFIRENGCGVTVRSLNEIRGILANMDPDTYLAMCGNARKIGCRLRSGAYTKRAVRAALSKTNN